MIITRMRWLGALVVLVLTAGAQAQQGGKWDDWAKDLLARHGRGGGLIALPRCSDVELLSALAARTDMVLYAQAQGDRIGPMRRALDSAGLLGREVHLARGDASSLHLADNLCDLVCIPDVTDADLEHLRPGELLRVAAPAGGTLWLGNVDPEKLSADKVRAWAGRFEDAKTEVVRDRLGLRLVVTKSALPGSADWTHRWFDGRNNPFSDDTALTWPFLTHWLSKPFHHTSRGITVLVADGRLLVVGRTNFVYKAGDERNDIFCMYNLYNGRMLWRRPLPTTFYSGFSNMVLTGEKLYMALGARVAVLDPETGEKVDEVEIEGLRGHIKWLALAGDVMTVLAGKADLSTELPDRRADRKVIHETNDAVEFEGRRLYAVNPRTGKTLWSRQAEAPISVRMIARDAHRLYYVARGHGVVALDLSGGEVAWSNTDEQLAAKLTEKPKLFDGIIKGRERGLTVLGDVLAVGSRGTDCLMGFAAQTGKHLWTRTVGRRGEIATGRQLRWIGVDGDLWMPGKVLDASSGQVTREQRFASGGCGVITGSTATLFTNTGAAYDLQSQRSLGTFNTVHKNACDTAGVVGGGVYFAGSAGCTCGVVGRGNKAQMAAKDFPYNQPLDGDDALERSSDYDKVEPLEVDPRDWPEYRGGIERSASTPVKVGSGLRLLHTARPPRTFEQDWLERYYFAEHKLTAPLAAAGRVFVGSTDGSVRCYGADGEMLWTAWTSGPILFAPTLANDRVYVGSGDGYLYCLEAANGRRLWRFRVAPVERRTLLYGFLASLWPVNSGVLVHDGVAYASAGLLPEDGMMMVAVDAVSGELVWQRHDLGRRPDRKSVGRAPTGGITFTAGRVWLNCGNTAYTAFDPKTGEVMALPENMQNPRKPQGSLGSDLGVYRGRYLVYGGQRLISDTYEREGSKFKIARWAGITFLPLDDGKPVYPEVGALPDSLVSPAWDEKLTVVVHGYRRLVEGWDTDKTLALLESKHRENLETKYPFYRHERVKMPGPDRKKGPPETPMRIWGTLDVDVSATAIAGDAVLIACGAGRDANGLHTRWDLLLVNRETGQEMARIELPAEPVSNGLAIDAAGRVYVACRDGRVLCYGR